MLDVSLALSIGGVVFVGATLAVVISLKTRLVGSKAPWMLVVALAYGLAIRLVDLYEYLCCDDLLTNELDLLLRLLFWVFLFLGIGGILLAVKHYTAKPKGG